MNKQVEKYASIGAIFLIVFGVLFFRRADAFTHPQFWAEDFPIFLQQYEQLGFRSLTTVYGGYMHFVPRLIAILWGTLHVDYSYLPLCYNLSAFFVTFLVAVNLWYGAGYLNLKNRIPYAVLFVLLPLWADIFMTITNVNFITGLVLVNFLLVWHTGREPRYYYMNLLLLFIISLNGPFSTILSPIVVIIFFVERKQMTIRKAVPLAIILFGGMVQGICIKFIDPDFFRGFPGATEKYHLIRFITNNMNRLVFLNKTIDKSETVSIVVSIVAFCILLWLFIRSYRKITLKGKYILPLTACLFLAAFIKTYWPNESLILAMENARYYFIPYTCIGWVFIAGNDGKIKLWHLIAYVVFFFLQREGTSFRLTDKHWKQQVREYYEGKRDTMEINPAGWHFIMNKKK
jgi:hypothetical protein